MSRFVIDASTALSWCFPDEGSSLAEAVVDRFRGGDAAIAPAFWPHEVLNALLSGEKRKRISRALVVSFLHDLSSLPIALQSSPPTTVFNRIQEISREHALTAYDAAYLDLALDMHLPLATLDGDLIRACERTGVELVES